MLKIHSEAEQIALNDLLWRHIKDFVINTVIASHAHQREASLEKIKLALKEGADPNCKDQNGRTPMMLAGFSNSLELMFHLKQLGARIDKEGAMHVNIVINNDAMQGLLFLLDHDVDFELKLTKKKWSVEESKQDQDDEVHKTKHNKFKYQKDKLPFLEILIIYKNLENLIANAKAFIEDPIGRDEFVIPKEINLSFLKQQLRELEADLKKQQDYEKDIIKEIDTVLQHNLSQVIAPYAMEEKYLPRQKLLPFLSLIKQDPDLKKLFLTRENRRINPGRMSFSMAGERSFKELLESSKDELHQRSRSLSI